MPHHEKCKDCICFSVEPEKSARLKIKVHDNRKNENVELVFDTRFRIPFLLFSVDVYEELFVNIRTPPSRKIKILDELITHKFAVDGMVLEPEDIEGVLDLYFSFPGDEKHGIKRSLPTFTFRDSSSLKDEASRINIMGLDAFRAKYIKEQQKRHNKKEFQIRIFPDRKMGYICRDVHTIECSHHTN